MPEICALDDTSFDSRQSIRSLILRDGVQSIRGRVYGDVNKARARRTVHYGVDGGIEDDERTQLV